VSVYQFENRWDLTQFGRRSLDGWFPVAERKIKKNIYTSMPGGRKCIKTNKIERNNFKFEQ